MRLIYGIIAVEERGKRVKEGKVCLLVLHLHHKIIVLSIF